MCECVLVPGGQSYLVAHRPAGELEELHRSRRCLDARHQLGERDDLLVDPEDPRLDVGIVLVRDVIDREHRSVLFRVTTLGPEGRILLLRGGGERKREEAFGKNEVPPVTAVGDASLPNCEVVGRARRRRHIRDRKRGTRIHRTSSGAAIP